MSRSPYYPRRRARLFKAESVKAAETNVDGRPSGIGKCAVCHVDVPIMEWDGLYYVQARLGCLGEAADAKSCPWRVYLEVGATEERDAAFPLDLVQREVDQP